jgi:hypothetical protein
MTMLFLNRLMDVLRRLPLAPRLFQFDEPLLKSLRRVAEREQRSEEEVAAARRG